MTNVDTIAAKAVIAGVEPQLFVADIRAACDFYVEKLGFGIVFSYGEPPYYAQVKRDSARLNFRCVDRPAIDPDFRDRAELLSATLVVATADEIRRLSVEFQKSEVTFVQTLAEKPWGARDFIIRDIDGNLLLFRGAGEIARHRVPGAVQRACGASQSRDLLR